MNPVFTGNLRMLAEFCIIAAFAGIIYQLIDVRYADHIGIIMGVALGFGFGIIELFILSGLKMKFLKLPLILSILIKAIIYLIIIYLFSGTV